MRLREALELVPDHRSNQGRRHSLGVILSLAVCGRYCPWTARPPYQVRGRALRGIHGEGIPGMHLVSAYAARTGAVLTQRDVCQQTGKAGVIHLVHFLIGCQDVCHEEWVPRRFAHGHSQQSRIRSIAQIASSPIVESSS